MINPWSEGDINPEITHLIRIQYMLTFIRELVIIRQVIYYLEIMINIVQRISKKEALDVGRDVNMDGSDF